MILLSYTRNQIYATHWDEKINLMYNMITLYIYNMIIFLLVFFSTSNNNGNMIMLHTCTVESYLCDILFFHPPFM